MLCTLTYQETITLDLHVEMVEWQAVSLSQQMGTASVFVPRNTKVFDLDDDGNPRYLDDNDASLIEIHHPHAGTWAGVIDMLTLDASGAQIDAVSIEAWLDIRKLTIPRVFQQTPAGIIASYIIDDAVAGLGNPVLHRGAAVIGGPTIERYEFTGQSALSGLQDLQDRTGQEWAVIDGTVHWLPFTGRVHERWLIEEGDLVAAARQSRPRDRVSEVVARDPFGQTMRVGNAEVSPFWPKQEVVNTR